MLRWSRAMPAAIASLALCVATAAAPTHVDQPQATPADELVALEAAASLQPALALLHETPMIQAPAPPPPHAPMMPRIHPQDSPLLRNLHLPARPAMVEEVVVYSHDSSPAAEQAPVVVPVFDEVLPGAPALNMLLIFILGLMMAHYGARTLRLRR